MYATLTSPMLPSSTVENYLKAIYKGTTALEAPNPASFTTSRTPAWP